VRYDPERVALADVTVPPYDVIDADERAALARRHPASAVVVDLPTTGDDVYAEAARTLERWQADGLLVRDDEPSFYVYRMTHDDEHGERRHTTGVFGALRLSRPGEGGILPHEHTTPKAKSDRLNLTRATRANLSAVWGLSASAGLSALLDIDDEPLAEWPDEAGITHALWRISDPAQIDAITAVADAAPVVIADGHHRYETALTYRDELAAADDRSSPGSASVLVYLVELADDELSVLPIHRLLGGLPDDFDIVGALEPFFDAQPAGPIGPGIADQMVERGALTLVLPDAAWFLVPRATAMAGVRDLDTSRLDVALATLPPHDLVFQHGVDQVVDRVRRGEAQAGVLLRPATVGQIIEIAHGGERMPPKTTFFHPKPRTGVVFRLLDE
jgi:uncharacterized protein (DUF1015 family)